MSRYWRIKEETHRCEVVSDGPGVLLQMHNRFRLTVSLELLKKSDDSILKQQLKNQSAQHLFMCTRTGSVYSYTCTCSFSYYWSHEWRNKKFLWFFCCSQQIPVEQGSVLWRGILSPDYLFIWKLECVDVIHTSALLPLRLMQGGYRQTGTSFIYYLYLRAINTHTLCLLTHISKNGPVIGGSAQFGSLALWL